MQTLLLRYTVTTDRQINLTLPPDFPVGAVEIVLRSADVPDAIDVNAKQQRCEDMKSFLAFHDALPPNRRTREDVDRQIQEERDSWER